MTDNLARLVFISVFFFQLCGKVYSANYTMAFSAQDPLFSDASSSVVIDPLTATAEELQLYLTNGSVTTLQLVDIYLKQIDAHNKKGLKLNGVISTAPYELLSTYAKELDAQRASGKVRGPLHGIPIIVKDNIMTDSELGMDTTCGAVALKGAKAGNAPIVERILRAGMIIIAKANLSEWAGSKGFGLVPGWSAVGGQAQTPYVAGGFAPGDKILGHSAPGGSSTGSAVSVAAGFAPLTLATEADGSITQPAGRSSLYGIKVTVGALDTRGTSPQSPITDSLGGMAKTSKDLALLIGAMMEQDYSSFLTRSWKNQKIAFVDPNLWELSPGVCPKVPAVREKQLSEIASAVTLIREHGASVFENVVLPQVSDLTWDGEDALETVWDKDLAKQIDLFLAEYKEAQVRTVEELIQYNKDHKELALPPEFPGQQQLENSLKSTLTDETRSQIISFLRTTAKDNGFDKIFAETGAEVLMGPLDARVVTVAAAAGYPCGVVPLGYADNLNGRAYGMAIVAKAGEEGKILEAMSAWEATMPGRKPPPLLKNFKSGL
ncbi:Amidase signature domain containing protein [Hyaloscypha variabilis]